MEFALEWMPIAFLTSVTLILLKRICDLTWGRLLLDYALMASVIAAIAGIGIGMGWLLSTFTDTAPPDTASPAGKGCRSVRSARSSSD